MLDSKKLKPAKRKKIKVELKVRILSLLDANGHTMNFFLLRSFDIMLFYKKIQCKQGQRKI
jgi:hypothetical protein